MAAPRSSIPHDTVTIRGLAAATSRMFSSPSGVSVAISTSRVDAVRNLVTMLEPVEDLRDLAHVAGVTGLGHDVALGSPGDGLLQVGFTPSPVAIGFIRTHRSRGPKSSSVSQRLTIGRVCAFRSGATASSRSRIRPSAGA